jgi:hypothetical protein
MHLRPSLTQGPRPPSLHKALVLHPYTRPSSSILTQGPRPPSLHKALVLLVLRPYTKALVLHPHTRPPPSALTQGPRPPSSHTALALPHCNHKGQQKKVTQVTNKCWWPKVWRTSDLRNVAEAEPAAEDLGGSFHPHSIGNQIRADTRKLWTRVN